MTDENIELFTKVTDVAKLNKKRTGPSLDAKYLDAIQKILNGGLQPS